MSYYEALTEAMTMLGQHPRSIFLGQAVAEKGTGMTGTFTKVPRDKLREMPVMENAQLGMCTGLALGGFLPISMFPRINFLLCAVDQLVLHLDALPLYSHGGYKPKVIIRTAIATPVPLDPGPQHLGDYTDALQQMLKTVKVVKLERKEDIIREYDCAMNCDHSTILVEKVEMYGT